MSVAECVALRGRGAEDRRDVDWDCEFGELVFDSCDDLSLAGPPEHRRLFIFDWDDTLMPSTWISQQKTPSGGVKPLTPAVEKCLADLEAASCALLENAALFGRVIIITNAEAAWINGTCRKYLPSLVDLAQTLHIVSARTRYQPVFGNSPALWKQHAFYDEIHMHLSCVAEDDMTDLDIFSIGDSIHERHAAQRVCEALAPLVPFNILSKTVKFIPQPELSVLRDQLNFLLDILPMCASATSTLDLAVQVCPKDQRSPPAAAEAR